MEHKHQSDIRDNNLLKTEIELKNSLIQKGEDDNDNLKKYNIFLMDQIRYLQNQNKNEIKNENNFF